MPPRACRVRPLSTKPAPQLDTPSVPGVRQQSRRCAPARRGGSDPVYVDPPTHEYRAHSYIGNMSPYYHGTMCAVFVGGRVRINILKDLYPLRSEKVFLFNSLFHREHERRYHHGQRLSQAADKEHTVAGGTLVCAPRPAANPSDRVRKWQRPRRRTGGMRPTL